MRLSIRATQIAAVSALVGVVVVVLSAMHVTRLARVGLHESEARGQLLANAIFHRVRQVVIESPDPYRGIQDDTGLAALLQSSIYGESVTDAAILNVEGTIVAHSDTSRVGQRLGPRASLHALGASSALDQLRAIYAVDPGTLEVQMPMELDGDAFGSIRIGVSTRLLRRELSAALRPALITAAVALAAAILLAGLLARVVLRPIHVIRTGLTRLGQGDFGVTLDLPPGDEFSELGDYFNSVSRQLSTDRAQQAEMKSGALVAPIEDAVALCDASGRLVFANSAMEQLGAARGVAWRVGEALLAGDPLQPLIEGTRSAGGSQGPVTVAIGDGSDERLVLTHAITSAQGDVTGVMVVARNAAYLSRMQSTLAYSRKLAALGRLTAGIAHEVKNPLNAMMIHLELLRSKIRNAPSGGEGDGGALAHVGVIESEVRRLDEVVQGFLKFARPEDLRLTPVSVSALIDDIRPLVAAEAERAGVLVEAPPPEAGLLVSGDTAMLRQVLMNLAINACQAMPHGGTLRLAAQADGHDHVEIRVSDTGVGIAPEDLGRIFNLYFTTKTAGSGIGLSMVYRIVQMHDGEIDVESTPGSGTTFRVRLPRAQVTA